jgi:hypothetical protein
MRSRQVFCSQGSRVGAVGPSSYRTLDWVIVSGAFLAEAATAVDNKLHVWGGVISHCGLGPERTVQLVLVALTQAETDNAERTIDVDIRPPNDEETLHIALEVPEATANAEIGFTYWPLPLHLPFDGRWLFVLTAAGGSAVSFPLVVSTRPPQP